VPIEERYPHAYWVGYYDSGEGGGKGMDATVYEPLVDLKFTNDFPGWLLIVTYVDLSKSSITFKLYSAPDGRRVTRTEAVITNQVPHGPPLYEENPELQPGQTRQVDYAVNGFDATVNRTVVRNGEVVREDSFFSRYIPWRAVYQVAPGHIPPGGESVGG
jgi:vancomycin resistance protein YoaR